MLKINFVPICVYFLVCLTVLHAAQRKYISYVLNKDYEVLKKTEIVADSNRDATAAEIKDVAIPYMVDFGTNCILPYTIGNDNIYLYRCLPVEPGNIAFFTTIYPPSIIANMFDGGTVGYSIHTYELFGKEAGVNLIPDSLDTNDYNIHTIDVLHSDTITSDDLAQIHKIVYDSSVVSLKGYGVDICVYKNDPFIYSDSIDFDLNFLVVVTHNTLIENSLNISVKNLKSVFNYDMKNVNIGLNRTMYNNMGNAVVWDKTVASGIYYYFIMCQNKPKIIKKLIVK